MREQYQRVEEEQHSEEDRPAVEIALDERAATKRPGATANPEGTGKAGVFTGVHEDQEHHDDRDRDLQNGKDSFHVA